MKQVILPTDFSDNSWRAMSYAAQLYANQPCEFVLLNTFHVSQNFSEVGVTMNMEHFQEEADKNMSEMEARFKELDRHDDSTIEAVAKFTSLVDAIQALEEKQPNNSVVVMGTKGANGLGELFLGTMTSHVLKHVSVPLICVPGDAQLTPPTKMMLAVDKEGVDRKDEIQEMIELAQNHGSQIAVVNVPEDADALFGDDLAEKFVIDHYLDKIKHEYHSLPGEYKEDVISRFADKEGVDLMVFVKRDRGFWSNLFHQSLTKSMAYHSDKPMLILRS